MPILTNRRLRVLSRQKGRDCFDDIDLALGHGLQLHGVRVLYSGDDLIAELPFRLYRDEDGEERDAPIFSFASEAAEEAWISDLAAALDEYSKLAGAEGAR